MSNVYEELYEHIKAFEQRMTTEPEGWDEFIADIKKKILQQQIASYQQNT
ncbi:MAG: hypothetical protein FWD06_09235 [Oscillospiraceae bacterium]|nr:hypothetical protein [Oscillospiraceae bacterium]